MACASSVRLSSSSHPQVSASIRTGHAKGVEERRQCRIQMGEDSSREDTEEKQTAPDARPHAGTAVHSTPVTGWHPSHPRLSCGLCWKGLPATSLSQARMRERCGGRGSVGAWESHHFTPSSHYQQQGRLNFNNEMARSMFPNACYFKADWNHLVPS